MFQKDGYIQTRAHINMQAAALLSTGAL